VALTNFRKGNVMPKKLSIICLTIALTFSFNSTSFAYLPKAKCKTDDSKCAKKANTSNLRNFAIIDQKHYLNEHNFRVLGKFGPDSMANKSYAASKKIKKYSDSSYGVCKDLLSQMSDLYSQRAATYFPTDIPDIRANLNGQVVALEDQMHANCNQVKMRW
jgi:hypothetical protein